MTLQPNDANHLHSRVIVDFCPLDILLVDEDRHVLGRPVLEVWDDADTVKVLRVINHKLL